MTAARPSSLAHRVPALVAVLFGLTTIVAGTRVLAGADPGYLVFRPLLLFNTVMGAVYVAAGLAAWKSARRGRYVAGGILSLNVGVLGILLFLRETANVVAAESVRAMLVRTAIWLVLFLALAVAARQQPD
jgi:sugar phosphate permease